MFKYVYIAGEQEVCYGRSSKRTGIQIHEWSPSLQRLPLILQNYLTSQWWQWNKLKYLFQTAPRVGKKVFTWVNIGQSGQTFSQYHPGLLKRFRHTGRFSNNSAIIIKLIWIAKMNVVFRKIFILWKTNTILQKKMWEVRILSASKRQEKCKNLTNIRYWQSIEDQNRILIEACGST